MSNGKQDAVIGISALISTFSGLGILGFLFSKGAQATQQPTITEEEPSEQVETQEHPFPDGTTEIKVTFPSGYRYVETMDLEFTPTLDINGFGDVGTLYIIVKKKSKNPEIYISELVEKDVHYKMSVAFGDYIEFIIVRVRVNSTLSKMNDIKVVLTKR